MTPPSRSPRACVLTAGPADAARASESVKGWCGHTLDAGTDGNGRLVLSCRRCRTCELVVPQLATESPRKVRRTLGPNRKPKGRTKSNRWTRYSELLRSPAWESKRFYILEQRNYTCEECKLEKFDWELNVHHRFYKVGAYPWEYDDADLRLLCRDCHEEITDHLERVNRAIGQLPISGLPLVVRYVETLLAADAFPRRLPLATAVDNGE